MGPPRSSPSIRWCQRELLTFEELPNNLHSKRMRNSRRPCDCRSPRLHFYLQVLEGPRAASTAAPASAAMVLMGCMAEGVAAWARRTSMKRRTPSCRRLSACRGPPHRRTVLSMVAPMAPAAADQEAVRDLLDLLDLRLLQPHLLPEAAVPPLRRQSCSQSRRRRMRICWKLCACQRWTFDRAVWASSSALELRPYRHRHHQDR
mmetsp:Transcript_150494/g.382610  ORF Transcript_150494/g.382610 Transcript_150494/m.382610 type:complete len:204 (+) Transcript_150494:621-1232(+)